MLKPRRLDNARQSKCLYAKSVLSDLALLLARSSGHYFAAVDLLSVSTRRQQYTD